jgi:hypothetical protein
MRRQHVQKQLPGKAPQRTDVSSVPLPLPRPLLLSTDVALLLFALTLPSAILLLGTDMQRAVYDSSSKGCQIDDILREERPQLLAFAAQLLLLLRNAQRLGRHTHRRQKF